MAGFEGTDSNGSCVETRLWWFVMVVAWARWRWMRVVAEI
jgi:hypothetical protein